MSIFGERAKETSTTGGTGTYSLAGAPSGFQTIVTAIGSGNKVVYHVVGDDAGTDAGKWEHGYGTVTSGSPDTLTRTEIFDSSNSGSAVNWTAGQTKHIFISASPHVDNSILTSHASTARPGWLPAKGMWLDTTADPWVLTLYDGTDDIPVMNINASTNAAHPITQASTARPAGLPSNNMWVDTTADPYVINFFDGTDDIAVLNVNASTNAAYPAVTTGTWTPVLTFVTPGDLSVAYAAQFGSYTRTGDIVTVFFRIETSAFSHSTASGNCTITGLPFTSANVTSQYGVGALTWQGITNANVTAAAAVVLQNKSFINIYGSTTGAALVLVGAGDMPSGGTVILYGSVTYKI